MTMTTPDLKAALAKPASGDGLPVAERICAIAKHSRYGKSLAAMLRDEVVIGDFREALVGLVHDMLRRLAAPEQPEITGVRDTLIVAANNPVSHGGLNGLQQIMRAQAERLRNIEQPGSSVQGEAVATVMRGTKRAHVVWHGREEETVADGAKLYTTPPPAPAAEHVPNMSSFQIFRKPPVTQPEARGVEGLQRYFPSKPSQPGWEMTPHKDGEWVLFADVHALETLASAPAAPGVLVDERDNDDLDDAAFAAALTATLASDGGEGESNAP